MTSYTRKLHKTDPAKAVSIHRKRYGLESYMHDVMLCYTVLDRDFDDNRIPAEFSRRPTLSAVREEW